MKQEYRKDLIKTAFMMIIMARDNMNLEEAQDVIDEMISQIYDSMDNTDRPHYDYIEVIREFMGDFEDYIWAFIGGADDDND